MSDICISQLQHVFSYWKDICGDLSSAWAPENVPGFGVWIYPAKESLQLAQYLWNIDSSDRDGIVLVRMRVGKSTEG